MRICIHTPGIFRTYIDAFSAFDTLIAVEGQLRMHLLRFWVCAPAAAQIAALEENCSAYAGTIMEGKFLDIEDMAGHLRTSEPLDNFYDSIV